MRRPSRLLILTGMLLVACGSRQPTPDLVATVNAQATELAELEAEAAAEAPTEIEIPTEAVPTPESVAATEPAAPTEAGPMPQGPPEDDFNPFTIDDPAFQACLQDALGEEVYTEMSNFRREPTEAEIQAIGQCIHEHLDQADLGEASGGMCGPIEPLPDPATFTRNTPQVIKGNWEPGWEDMMRLMQSEVKNLKALGVNTVSISVEHSFNPDGSAWVQCEDQIIANIARAKQAGFAVLLAPNFVGARGVNFAEQGIDMNLDRYLELSAEVAMQWATIAEEYQVEFFAPQNEFDSMLENFTPDQVEQQAITGEWHRALLPELQSVYSGRLMAKLVQAAPTLDVSGYEYIGVTVFHYFAPLDEFRQQVARQYSDLAQAAQTSDAQWLPSEVWFPYGGTEYFPETTNRAGESLDELQDDYFQIAIDEYQRVADEHTAGFVFIAYLMSGMDIKGRPAEEVVQEFFAEPGP